MTGSIHVLPGSLLSPGREARPRMRAVQGWMCGVKSLGGQRVCNVGTTLTPGTGKSVAKQSRSQPGPNRQFTGLEREVGARRQAGWEEAALGCLRTRLKTMAGRWCGDLVGLFLAIMALPLGQPCHGFTEERVLMATTCKGRRGRGRDGCVGLVFGSHAPGSHWDEQAGRTRLGSSSFMFSSFVQPTYPQPYQN